MDAAIPSGSEKPAALTQGSVMPVTDATPPRKKGAHKPECTCGWCETKRGNIAKKNATMKTKPDAAKPSAENSASKSGSGDASKSSSARNSAPPAPGMAAKIAAMKPKSPKSPAHEPAAKIPAAAPAEQSWFDKLFSGATFFED